MCYSDLGFLLQQRVKKAVLPCSQQSLSLVISTAFTIFPETRNSKKLSLSHEGGVWYVYIHVQGAAEQWDTCGIMGNDTGSSLFTPLSAKHSWHSSVVWLHLNILQKSFILKKLKPFLAIFFFHNIAKILQQSQDTSEKCNFKENNVIFLFHILLLPQSNSVLWERD